MSTFACPVVPIRLDPHPNADALSLVRVHDYTVAVRTQDWEDKGLGVYVPIDAMLDTARPEFAFLANEANKAGFHRLRAKRLRGVFSMGLLVPLPHDAEPGTDLAAALGVTKYEEPEVRGRGGPANQAEAVPPPPGDHIPKYTDIEHLRRFHVFEPGETVVVTEKVHGANSRYAWRDNSMHLGSRNQWKRAEVGSAWYEALTVPMIRLCQEIEPLVLCGEVYGRGVQDLWYGCDRPTFVAFDVYNPRIGAYIDFAAARDLCRSHGVPFVPALYVGPYADLLAARFADQNSVVATIQQMSEGVVVRPLFERDHAEIGRCIVKYPGERYLLRKEAA